MVMVIIISFLVLLIALVAGLYGLYKYKNRLAKPDYFEYYKTQDTVPEGKVGVFSASLIMPTNHNHAFFHNIIHKVFKAVVPWPFNILAMKDSGVALLDPAHVHAREEFTPTHLEDCVGNDRDLDGTPYIEKYRRGEIVWVPPSSRIYLDHGYFLYKGHPSGEPTICGKTANKSRLYYYGSGITQRKLPHWEDSFKIINTAFDRIRQNHTNVELRSETSMFYYEMRKKLHELLDAGCETIILIAPTGIYSHFEEFNSAFRHCFEYIDEWKEKHPGKKVKVIIGPQMGDFQPLRQAFLEMLKDRLDVLPEGSDVTVAVTVHGMPWDSFKWEAWLQLAPAYRDKLFEEVKEMVAKYKFGRTNVIICQDEFADPIWDPDQHYLSTNRAYWKAINDGYDYAIGLPIEFYAENSDTLMHHAMKCFENFEQYNVDDPVDYPDWSVPYVRELVQGKTHCIYNGVPVGKYQKYVIDAFYQSIDSVLSKRKG
jgi:protoheme ferro-lyase